MFHRTGILCVVSGPSGSGKTTLCRATEAVEENIHYTTSCTTRAPREGETDGEDYFFLGVDEFERRVAAGEFLEHALVHGNFYGTLKSEVVGHLAEGRDVIMDIDVQGAALIRACEDAAIVASRIDVFIVLPSMKEVRARLAKRGTETEEQLALRLKNAVDEMRDWDKYDYVLTSAERESDLARFRELLAVERLRTSRLTAQRDGDLLAE